MGTIIMLGYPTAGGAPVIRTFEGPRAADAQGAATRALATGKYRSVDLASVFQTITEPKGATKP